MKGTHLAIQLADNAIQFVVIQNDFVSHTSQIKFEDSIGSNQKEPIENHIKNTSQLNHEFDEVTLSWSFKRSTLVPNSIFADSNAKDIYELCYGKDSLEHDIDYNRISELSVINIYEIPVWIKRFFVIKYPRIVIQHEGSHVIRMSLNTEAFKLKSTAILYKGYFLFSIVKHNNLEFYSFFDYQNHEDIIYHMLFTFHQKEMTNENGTMEFILGPGINSDVLTNLKTDLERISDLKKLKIVTPKHYIAKSQLLCV
ncbi:MAG: DUF3822 family protein [Crocinitomicaceae bacterium]|nr:DUF3822 family protein [Crocinitomicaceae bacterium]